MYYANEMFEGIMLKGYGLGSLSETVAIVAAMALIFFLLALSTVKDRMG